MEALIPIYIIYMGKWWYFWNSSDFKIIQYSSIFDNVINNIIQIFAKFTKYEYTDETQKFDKKRC